LQAQVVEIGRNHGQLRVKTAKLLLAFDLFAMGLGNLLHLIRIAHHHAGDHIVFNIGNGEQQLIAFLVERIVLVKEFLE